MKSQKYLGYIIQRLFNYQAITITRMYCSTLLYLLLWKTRIILTSTHLDYYQSLYTYYLLSLPDLYIDKNILSGRLKIGDERFQHKELLDDIFMWIENAWSTLYGLLLAWQITIDYFVNLANKLESVEVIRTGTCFEKKIVIRNKELILLKAIKDQAGRVLQTDESKLDNNIIETVIYRKYKRFQ